MSGIVGIVNLDGTTVNRQILQHLTEFITYRGVDAQQVWHSGCVGFGNTLLRTTTESTKEHQPFTLDGTLWITADARIDGRRDLLQKLNLDKQLPITDVELILRAYQLWGQECVHHLLGDFSFALWDSRKKSLFCARDQLGIKLFYYAHIGNSLIFSNTLKCLRQHPLVSQELNQQAIGDFLLFDQNYTANTTAFAQIQRLQAAHTLTVFQSRVKQQRYWQLPVPDLIRYPKPEDYVSQFQELLQLAVIERLRTDKAAIFFSGGLDSTSISSIASTSSQLQGFTAVYDHLIPDQERYYSQLAATALGIPITYLVEDDYQLYQGWQQPELHTPEPYHDPLCVMSYDQLQQIATYSRIALNGQGGDEALRTSTVSQLRPGMNIVDLILDLGRCLWQHKLLPPLGSGILAQWRRWHRGVSDTDYYPQWLNPDFEARLQLKERWREINELERQAIHPLRPQAYQDLLSLRWQPFFESYDSGFSHVPVEVRFPFLDLRLLNFLLAIPPLPWFVNKHILRTAMQGKLPEEVRLRPKTPLMGDPFSVLIAKNQQLWQVLKQTPEIKAYVNTKLIIEAATKGKIDAWQAWEFTRPVSLSNWLNYR